MGARTAVRMPLAPMATPAKAAERVCCGMTREAPIPLPAVPAARPRAEGSLIFSQSRTGSIEMATRMPPRIARTAEREGMPPMLAETAMAIGVVRDLGAMERATAWPPPSRRTMA